MTLQLISRSVVAATLEHRSFWRRLVDAIEASQRRRAEQVITAYLGRHRGEYHDELAREFERRFLGNSREAGDAQITRHRPARLTPP